MLACYLPSNRMPAAFPNHRQTRVDHARSVCCALAVSLLVGCDRAPTQTNSVPSSRPSAQPASVCADKRLTLQVLGSGGPVPDDARASSGYVLWHGGKSRVLVDIGGGVILRFAEAGARVAELDVVAVSHLHADHVAGLPALFKASYFAERDHPLKLSGPSGNDHFPAFDAHIDGLLARDSGLFRYLAPQRGDVVVAPADATDPVVVHTAGDLKVSAVGVVHHNVPALGYLVRIRDKRVAFGGDQGVGGDAFKKMITGADLLIAHHAVGESATGGVLKLHRTPTQIAELAREAGVKRLILSHHMAPALAELERGLAAIRAIYDGPVEVANDLSCYPLAR